MRERQHLIVDADDTLWENNIYFERAFDQFCDFLDHSSLSPEEVRGVLDEIETVNSKVHGYGTLNFTRNLTECYHKLVERDVYDDDLARIMSFTEQILHHPIEVIPGVEETLDYLSLRHDLTLFTKGNPEEQKLKLDRSGLAVYFGHTAIVKEKDPGSYSALISSRRFDSQRTWMIGKLAKIGYQSGAGTLEAIGPFGWLIVLGMIVLPFFAAKHWSKWWFLAAGAGVATFVRPCYQIH